MPSRQGSTQETWVSWTVKYLKRLMETMLPALYVSFCVLLYGELFLKYLEVRFANYLLGLLLTQGFPLGRSLGKKVAASILGVLAALARDIFK